MMRKLPEPIFEPEFDAAKSLGFTCFLFDEEALSSGEMDLAFKHLPSPAGRCLKARSISPEDNASSSKRKQVKPKDFAASNSGSKIGSGSLRIIGFWGKSMYTTKPY